MSGIVQFIALRPFLTRYSLVLEKGRLPKNPRYADSGLGCGEVMIRCLGFVIMDCLRWAGLPQRMKTIGLSWAASTRMAASVNSSQPMF